MLQIFLGVLPVVEPQPHQGGQIQANQQVVDGVKGHLRNIRGHIASRGTGIRSRVGLSERDSYLRLLQGAPGLLNERDFEAGLK